MKTSIGIFVYNEEKNIGRLLQALIKQKTKQIKIIEIVVVSSGSTDRTNSIVRHFSKIDKKIKLIVQKTRGGKAAAMNLFLKRAKGEIIVVSSGDVIPKEDCIEKLGNQFIQDSRLGMTGANAIPTNDKNTFLGYIIHYWWWMSAKLPRLGEMIAFRRNLISQIDEKIIVDEAYIEAVIAKKGYTVKVIESAIISNRGADNIKDLIKQRKRNYIGHKNLLRKTGYGVASFNFFKIARLTFGYLIGDFKIRYAFWIVGGAFIELYARFLGFMDMTFRKKNPYIWDIAQSTKKI